MFEKIHSFSFREQLMEEMADLDNEVFLIPLTIHEKRWLKQLLKSDDAIFYLNRETIWKLEDLLQDIDTDKADFIVEKFKVKTLDHNQDRKNIDCFRKIRDGILNKKGIQISYQTNDGSLQEKLQGIPMKLEYLIHKAQWSVIWLPIQAEHELPDMIYTPLHQIVFLEIKEVSKNVYQDCCRVFEEMIRNEKVTAHLRINQMAFQQHSIEEEKQRILYALSCFEKELIYHEADNNYEILVYFRQNEVENFLQKIRLLGKRVIIQSPDFLKKRIAETAQNSLKRYR